MQRHSLQVFSLLFITNLAPCFTVWLLNMQDPAGAIHRFGGGESVKFERNSRRLQGHELVEFARTPLLTPIGRHLHEAARQSRSELLRLLSTTMITIGGAGESRSQISGRPRRAPVRGRLRRNTHYNKRDNICRPLAAAPRSWASDSSPACT